MKENKKEETHSENNTHPLMSVKLANWQTRDFPFSCFLICTCKISHVDKQKLLFFLILDYDRDVKEINTRSKKC